MTVNTPSARKHRHPPSGIISVIEDQIITPPSGIMPMSGSSARSCMGSGDLPGVVPGAESGGGWAGGAFAGGSRLRAHSLTGSSSG